jgi:hypothetical protein
MVGVIFRLIIGIALNLTQNPAHFFQMPQARIDSFLQELAKQQPDFTQRLIKVTEGFLGTRYLISPLGEGPGHLPDEDPLMRFDAVDCVTFVEEAMALARSENLAQAQAELQKIRYLNATVDYRYRKHFTMAQWIPENQKAGFLEDITESIAGKSTIWVTKRLDAQIWNQRTNKNIWPKLEPNDIPQGDASLPIVPLNRMKNFLPNIPNGVVLLIVRQDRPTIPERVSHIGIVVLHNGRLWLRHAASGKIGKVIDEPFDTVIRRHTTYRRLPVSGYNFQRVSASNAVLFHDPRQ